MTGKGVAMTFYTTMLMLGVIQALFSLGLSWGVIPPTTTIGQVSAWLSAALWMVFLFVGWRRAPKKCCVDLYIVLLMAVFGSMCIANAIIHISGLTEVAGVYNAALWLLFNKVTSDTLIDMP